MITQPRSDILGALEKNPESKSIIRFPDCDPFNHLNNSKYIDYFLNAREDQLSQHYNLDLYKLAAEKKIGWVVSEHQIVYLKPAMLMEAVIIQTRLISYTEKDVTVELIMWSENKTNLKSVMWTKFAHFNLMTKKSEIHSQKFMELFRDVVVPLNVTGFEKRVEELKGK
jgi:thioesterase-3